MSNNYMLDLINAVKSKAKEDGKMCAAIIGTMAGSEEAYIAFGSEEKAFKTATKYVNESETFEDALGKFYHEITESPKFKD